MIIPVPRPELVKPDPTKLEPVNPLRPVEDNPEGRPVLPMFPPISPSPLGSPDGMPDDMPEGMPDDIPTPPYRWLYRERLAVNK